MSEELHEELRELKKHLDETDIPFSKLMPVIEINRILNQFDILRGRLIIFMNYLEEEHEHKIKKIKHMLGEEEFNKPGEMTNDQM